MTKKIIWLVWLLSATCFIRANAQTLPASMAAVAFYNVENLFHPSDEPHKYDEAFTPSGAYHYTKQIYRKKLHNIAFTLAQIGRKHIPDGAALIGLAEVENDSVLFDLVRQPEIRNRHYRFVHFEAPDARGIDVALLYNPKHFKLLNAHAIPAYWSRGSERHPVRDILYVSGTLAGDTLHVLIVHWPSRIEGLRASTPKRLQVAAICKKTIVELQQRRPHARIIVMGDFNDNPVNKSIVTVLDATDNRAAITGKQLYNPWLPIYKKGKGTTVYHRHWNLFDQILLSASFLQRPTSGWVFDHAAIFNAPFLITRFGKYKGYPHRSFSGTRWIDGFSDHYPALIYLKWQSLPEGSP